MARTLRRGADSNSPASGAASSTCSKLSSTSRSRLSLQVVLQALDKRLVPALPHAQRLRDGRGDQRGVGDGGERHEEDAVLELSRSSAAACSARRVLPVPPGPVRVRRRTSGAQKPPSDVLHLPLAPNERGGLHGQVVRAALERPQGTEIGGQIRRQELKDALGADEILQAMFPEIPQLRTHRQLITHQLLGRQREEGLAPVPRRQEPGDPVEGRAEVVPVPLLGRSPCARPCAPAGAPTSPQSSFTSRLAGRRGPPPGPRGRWGRRRRRHLPPS